MVKLLAIAAALVCALAVLAGPALSGERWRPDPVDFELAPPAGAAAAASGRVTSRPLRAPKRFNLVGLRWRGTAEPTLALRVRKRGERWSRWQPLEAHADHNPDPRTGERGVAASDPLWVGEADEVQYRLSRRVPGLRLHFVNVQGTATARGSAAHGAARHGQRRDRLARRAARRRGRARAGAAAGHGQPLGVGRLEVPTALGRPSTAW